jgi:hypothetical protein
MYGLLMFGGFVYGIVQICLGNWIGGAIVLGVVLILGWD